MRGRGRPILGSCGGSAKTLLDRADSSAVENLWKIRKNRNTNINKCHYGVNYERHFENSECDSCSKNAKNATQSAQKTTRCAACAAAAWSYGVPRIRVDVDSDGSETVNHTYAGCFAAVPEQGSPSLALLVWYYSPSHGSQKPKGSSGPLAISPCFGSLT